MPLPKTNGTVLPGYVLSQFRLKQIKMAEDYFAQRVLDVAARTAMGLPVEMGDRVIAAAVGRVAKGEFSYDSAGFKAQMLVETNLPYLLWICLCINAPQTTFNEASGLITDENTGSLMRALMDMLGYSLPNAGQAASQQQATPPASQATTPATDASNPSPSPGTVSSEPSEAKDSATTTSTI